MADHPLKGRKQSREHIRKRIEATLRTKAAWTDERRALYRQRVSESSRSADPDVRLKISIGRRGKTPWNKGNNWRDRYTPEEIRAINAEWARNRRARDPRVRIHNCVSAMMRQALRANKAGRKWETLVGYDLAALMAHLEGQFQPGMTWDNAGEWHIDHIVPRSAFEFSSEQDATFKECWALDNLQPLWAIDNLRKAANRRI